MQALRAGRPALAEHDALFGLMTGLDRDVMKGIVQSVIGAVGHGEIGAIFDGMSAAVAHQALLLPYYFALFHQNREREHLGRITGLGRDASADSIRVGVFTDLPDGQTDAAQFTRSVAAGSSDRGQNWSCTPVANIRL